MHRRDFCAATLIPRGRPRPDEATNRCATRPRRYQPHPPPQACSLFAEDSLPQEAGPAPGPSPPSAPKKQKPLASPVDPDRAARLERDFGGYQLWRLKVAELIYHDDAVRLKVCRAGGCDMAARSSPGGNPGLILSALTAGTTR